MATPSKGNTTPSSRRAPTFASAQADDAERAKTRNEAHMRGAQKEEQDKTVTRNDPQEQGNKDRVAAEAEARPEGEAALPPQVGMSSSELNTATPAMKQKATEEAEAKKPE